MPLPAEVDRKARALFDELIDESERLLEDFDANSEDQEDTYKAWCVKASGLVLWLHDRSDEAKRYQDHFEAAKLQGHTYAGFTREAVR